MNLTLVRGDIPLILTALSILAANGSEQTAAAAAALMEEICLQAGFPLDSVQKSILVAKGFEF